MPVETLAVSCLVLGCLFVASGPMASAHVSIAAAAGGNNMIPRPYEVVKRRGPGAQNKHWYFGRDQIDNSSGIVAEIRS